MKVDLIKTLKSKYPRIKKVKKENDLTEDMIIDSMELMEFIILIEKKYNFQTKKYLKKNKVFKIKLMEDFIKK